MARGKPKTIDVPRALAGNLTVGIPKACAPLTDRIPLIALGSRWRDLRPPETKNDVRWYERETQSCVMSSWFALTVIVAVFFFLSLFAGKGPPGHVINWISFPIFAMIIVGIMMTVVEAIKPKAHAADFWVVTAIFMPLGIWMIAHA